MKITPEEPGYLLAYDRHQKAEGIESELWARAIALEDANGQRAVLVSADILGFPPSLARVIRRDAQERFGLKDGELLLAASHTHNGPVLPESPSLEIYHGFTEAGTPDGCIPAVARGMTPNQGGTWWFGRGGWCPGAPVEPWIVDVSALVTPGTPIEVSYQGLLGGRTPPDGSGSIVLTSYLVTYE